MKKLTKKLTKNILEKIKKDEVDWVVLCSDYELSEDFIRKYQDKVSWGNISICQTLTEGFIREFQDKVNWANISYIQKLSDEFILEFQNKIHFRRLMSNKVRGDENEIFLCSKEIQKLMLENIISDLDEYAKSFFTPYMIEEYKKVNIFL
jgi:hypothetical protein